MKKIQDIIKVAGLIAKNISNQINSEEKETLYFWKDRSEKNKKLYDKITDWDNFQERNQTYKQFDTEKAWGKFSQKINKPTYRIRVLSVLKYAAAIAIPLILGGIIFYNLNKQNDNTHEIASISPGTQNAIIVLDNGKTINLEDEQLNQLVEKDGSIIRNEKGELSYLNVKSKRAKKQLQNTLIVPRGGEYNLVLSDGSRVFLNSVSKLTYPVVFDNNKREVKLEGEAYFEIVKDKSKPFLVNINGMKIEVLGTSFNVKAYTDDDKIYATLVEGKIKLNTDQNENNWILVPDQQAILKKSSNKVEVREVDVQQFISWKNGMYTFTNQTLEEILKTLSRWYDFEYEFSNESLKSIRFEGGLNKYDDVYPILDIMRSTGKLSYKIDGKKITFIQK